MFERPRSGERAILVHAAAGGAPDTTERDEFVELATSAGAVVVDQLVSARKRPDPRFFIGKGKVEDLSESVRENQVELIISSAPLSPSQERNLEKSLNCRVLDRSGLILDIFAQRARTFEGKLQVELAQLRHLSTRLIRGWTHLERQKGGIGLRGPGETQLETDRRLIGKRIRQIKGRLDQVGSRRAMNRQNRVRAEIATVALVGYTNAGKSTLFNALTDAGVYVEDKLFATLDPTMRKIKLPDDRHAILVDTVGFIRDLPHELIAAFRSTLQETKEADLILHLIDASDADRWRRVRQVNAVLKEIDADQVPQIRVYNKIDKLNRRPRLTNNRRGEGRAVWLSAVTGEGISLLPEAIGDRLRRKKVNGTIRLKPSQGRLRAVLFDLGAVQQESALEDGGWLLELNLGEREFLRLLKRENLPADILQQVATAESSERAEQR